MPYEIVFQDENGDRYGIKHVGNKPRISAMPYLYDIAEGNVSGHTAVEVSGYNAAVGAADETVWEGSDLYSWLSAATKLLITSGSSNDDKGGVGAVTVQVIGLNSSYSLVTENVTMNGRSGASTSNYFLRINELHVTGTGSGNSNSGIIYAGTGTTTVGVPTKKYGQIAIHNNHSLHGFYTTPAGVTAYLLQLDASTGLNKATQVKLFIRNFGEVFQLEHTFHFQLDNVAHNYSIPKQVPPKSDIEIRAVAAGGGGAVAAGFEAWIED